MTCLNYLLNGRAESRNQALKFLGLYFLFLKNLLLIGGWLLWFLLYINMKVFIFSFLFFFFEGLYYLTYSLDICWGFPGGSDVKASASNAGDEGSIHGSGRSPGEGNGNPLQCSCLENPMVGGA